MATHLVVQAHAKVNLTLDVLFRRPDGYHEIMTVLQPLILADTLQIEAARPDIKLSCSDPKVPEGDSNLVLLAARVLQLATGTRSGAWIHVEKRIPVAAGLGGGSADAAAALVGLNRAWDTGLTLPQLSQLAGQIGSDVPFCLLNHTALGEGRGERLTLLPSAPAMAVVLAIPQVSWPGPKTATVYRALRLDRIRLRPDLPAMRVALATANVPAIAAAMGNVLEPTVAAMHPIIYRLKKAMLDAGALGACLTGAGAAVVALAESTAAAEHIAAAVRAVADKVILTGTLTTGTLGGTGS